MESVEWDEFLTLDDIRNSFSYYLHQDYHHRPHSALRTADNKEVSPMDRYAQDIDRIKKISNETLNELFLYRVERKVLNDATVSIKNIKYELPISYVREKVSIYLDPANPSEAWVIDKETGEKLKIRKLNKVENINVRRKKGINFQGD